MRYGVIYLMYFGTHRLLPLVVHHLHESRRQRLHPRGVYFARPYRATHLNTTYDIKQHFAERGLLCTWVLQEEINLFQNIRFPDN